MAVASCTCTSICIVYSSLFGFCRGGSGGGGGGGVCMCVCVCVCVCVRVCVHMC